MIEPGFGASLEKLWLEDLTNCVRITKEHIKDYGLLDRLLSWVAYQFRHWL